MNKMQTSLHLWNGLKRSAKLLAALAVASALGSVAQGQITYTPTFSNAWVVVAGAYPDLTNDANNNVRGIAINPVNNNVLYASRGAGSNHVSVLSSASGSNFLGALSGYGVAGGNGAALDQVRVSDDGAIYGCNLNVNAGSTFKLYRWASDSDFATAPATVYSATSPLWRMGDYMDLRGGGINTEIVVVGNGAGANITTNFTIFRPTDSTCLTFTNFSITIPGGVVNYCGAGVAFEGANNALWVRRSTSQETRHIVYNPTTLTAICDRTNNVDQSVCQGLKYYTNNGVQLLATVQANTANGASQIARVFQIPIAPTGSFTPVLSANIPAVTGSVNGNPLGAVDSKNGYFVFGAPGHGLSFFNIGFVTNSPPAVTISGSASTLVAGYNFNATFTGAATGTSPLKYQWYFTDSATFTNPITTGITNVCTVTNVQTANAGGYFVIVTNLYGKATSSVTKITVLPNGGSALAKPLWSLAPGAVDYLTGAGTDTQRGLGYDPLYQRLVVVSQSPTNGVHLLDAATGADQGDMDISPLLAVTPPGTYPLNICGVADDGAVYVGNLITSASSDNFVIYRWNSATNTETMSQAYAGNPLGDLGTGITGSIGRIGDTMAVRGVGANTQIICTFRNGTNAAIFTTTDGFSFTCNIIAITNLAASIGATDPFTGLSPIGLGVAWGSGNTFWAKSSSYNLRQISFDLASGTGAVIGSYAMPPTEAPLGVDIANGYVALVGTLETPANLPIYNLNLPNGPTLSTLVDREVFAVNNANGNGTGAVAFDLAGGRIFALSSNSGILALTYAGKLAIKEVAGEQILTWSTPSSVLQSSANVAGPYLDVSGATSPYTNNVGSMQFFRLRH